MNYIDRYGNYIAHALPHAGLELFEQIETIGLKTNWENPQSDLDWHNLAVIAMIEAKFASDNNIRLKYFNLASNYLQKSINYPLSFVHYIVLLNLIGETNPAILNSYNFLLQSLQKWLGKKEAIPTGLVFLPENLYSGLIPSLIPSNGYSQAGQILGMLFYSTCSAQYLEPRRLSIAVSLIPDFVPALLKLGLDYIYRQQYEGLFYLHQAQKLEPHNPDVVHSLYLAYKKLQNPIVAQYWQEMGRNFYLATDPQNPNWLWATLPDRDDFTYVFFQQSILLAVLPDLAQIVTIVLLAEGDWFEAEMEFWIGHIQAGMTIIDVGANVGVYTFSAAREVGETGRVIAIEPFPPCVNCLEETKRVNNLPQVTIKQACASNQSGILHLATSPSSELNAVTTDPNALAVEAITIDELIQSEGLTRVDILKIDAEGHELEVLQGCRQLLERDAPLIMYENISAQSSNTPVAIYLQEQGYKLYRYRPFLCQMIPIGSLEELNGVLNVIARKD